MAVVSLCTIKIKYQSALLRPLLLVLLLPLVVLPLVCLARRSAERETEEIEIVPLAFEAVKVVAAVKGRETEADLPPGQEDSVAATEREEESLIREIEIGIIKRASEEEMEEGL